jgi:GxxExxY protein
MKAFEPLPPETERIAAIIVDSAFKVHRTIGPGLLESIYELCLAHELRQRGLSVGTKVSLPIIYEGLRIEGGLLLDVVVEKLVIIEIKAVERMIPVFDAQLLTYLKLTGLRLGLLINFNVPLIKDGIKRIVL